MRCDFFGTLRGGVATIFFKLCVTAVLLAFYAGPLHADSYDEALHEKLRVGLQKNYRPFSYYSKYLDEYRGLAYDVAMEICKRMQAKCTLVFDDYVNIESGLWQGNLDFAVGNFVRLEHDDMGHLPYSDYYIKSYPVIISSDYSVVFSSAEDLRSYNFGVRADSLEQQIMEHERLQSRVAFYTIYGTHSEMLKALKRGEVDALYTDNISAYSMLKHEKIQLFLSPDKYDLKNTYADICLAISPQRKDLLNKVNAILRDMKKDKALKRISMKYMQNISNGL